MAADLKPIYRAATAEQAREELDRFIEKWGRKYQAIGRLWLEQWERIIPFFAFTPEIRKVIYTTNAVESLHMSLRKVIKNRGSFPNEESASNCCIWRCATLQRNGRRCRARAKR